MTEPAFEKLPTVEQVEVIMQDWGGYSIEEFAARFQLEPAVVAKTVYYLRKLMRVAEDDHVPAAACLRSDTLESIVRCAGARHGYV